MAGNVGRGVNGEGLALGLGGLCVVGEGGRGVSGGEGFDGGREHGRGGGCLLRGGGG